jgi:hypothetical protein
MNRNPHNAVRRGRRQFLQGVAGLGLSVGGASLLAACSRLAVPGSTDRAAPGTVAARGAELETTKPGSGVGWP